ncbi:MAG: SAM-dependent methyltransferase [Methylohalobius sp. ZOD2]|nr:SAM-dependent methyltransferase [Methylothermaceae bacterium]
MEKTVPPLSVLLSVTLISVASLAGEILLMRLLSIIQWHHFAYIIISLALLGYGASGTLVSLARIRIRRHFARLFPAACLAFAASLAGGFLLAQKIAFNPLELLWDPHQWLRLIAVYVLLLWPFLFAASAVCLTLIRFESHIGRIYACDLIGAATGALGVIALLEYFFPLTVLGWIAAVACLAATLSWFGLDLKPRIVGVVTLIMAGLLPLGLAQGPFQLRLSPYKPLSQALSVTGARTLEERAGPLGLLTVVASPEVPFRHAPGLSLSATTVVPPQLAVFTDGDGMSVITRFEGDLELLAFLGQMPSTLPYRLLHHPSVLVLGAGGGIDVLQALYHDAGRIDAVELDPNLVDLVQEEFADFAGHLYQHPKVHVHSAEARGFVTTGQKRFDLIQVGLLDAFNTASSGLHALNETYLYTVEGMAAYVRRLTPRGMLAITRWIRIPPREELKLFATAVAALKTSGMDKPERHLAWIRSWNTITLLVKPTPFRDEEIETVRQFCQTNGFDPAYYPGIRSEEINRRHRLPQAYYHQAATAILRDDQDFFDDYKFDIRPATDDRPYFFHTFKWSTLEELWALRAHGGIALLDSAYLLLLGTLGQLILLSTVLIAAPLLPGSLRRGTFPRAMIMGYFFAIGIGFIFLEVAFIQKFILYLSHPLYAVAVVLTGMLFWAGLGSASLAPLQRLRPNFSVWWPVLGISALALFDLGCLPGLIETTASAADWLKIVISQMLLAPLAWCMGFPFPLGMARLVHSQSSLETNRSDWIAWAWAVNGCASVIGAVLAGLLAIHLGLTALVGLGLTAYLTAGLLLPRH